MMQDDLSGLERARAVWDFTTGDERRFLDRMDLLKQTAAGFRARGIPADFVVLIHGPATRFVARSHAQTKFGKDPCPRLADAHALLAELAELGVRIEVCLIAMDRAHVARDNLIAGVAVEDNVFLNSIALQNKGYACMRVD